MVVRKPPVPNPGPGEPHVLHILMWSMVLLQDQGGEPVS